MDLYTKNALECSKITTHNYTTSFSLGIRSICRKYRQGIYAIYGFVRTADEIVDTFHEKDKNTLLQSCKKEAFDAIENRVSTNPLIHSFQWVVNKYEIEKEVINDFFCSMEMDLTKTSYNHRQYKEYIYGSAEVIGLMCLRVFCDGDKGKYNQLKDYAQKLGEAMQKVNFLRDFGSDYSERERIYFPEVDFNNFDRNAKKLIEKEIRQDFEMAFAGIKKLNSCTRFGIYLAYCYYFELLKKIESTNAEKLKSKRLRISNFKKLLLFVVCYIRHIFNRI